MSAVSKYAFVLLILISQISMAVVAEFVVGDDMYYGCKYELHSPILYKLDRAGCGDVGDENDSICTGTVKCSVYNSKTGATVFKLGTVGCSANPDGSCPLAAECYQENSPLIKSADPEPKIRKRPTHVTETENLQKRVAPRQGSAGAHTLPGSSYRGNTFPGSR